MAQGHHCHPSRAFPKTVDSGTSTTHNLSDKKGVLTCLMAEVVSESTLNRDDETSPVGGTGQSVPLRPAVLLEILMLSTSHSSTPGHLVLNTDLRVEILQLG